MSRATYINFLVPMTWTEVHAEVEGINKMEARGLPTLQLKRKSRGEGGEREGG